MTSLDHIVCSSWSRYIVPRRLKDKISAFTQTMTWQETCDKPLHESMMAKVIWRYMTSLFHNELRGWQTLPNFPALFKERLFFYQCHYCCKPQWVRHFRSTIAKISWIQHFELPLIKFGICMMTYWKERMSTSLVYLQYMTKLCDR